jgi:hypothetical protein
MATWRATRLWLGLEAAALVAFVLTTRGRAADMSEARFTFSLVCLVLAMGLFLVVYLAIQRLYRCPKCDQVPYSFRNQTDSGLFSRGLLLNPRSCPTCGAILRVDG